MRSLLISLASISLLLTATYAQEPEASAPALRALPFEEPLPAPEQAPAPAPAPGTAEITPAPAAPVTPTAPVAPPEPVTPPIELKPTGDDAVRLQIFLDESNFGPGVIDGKPGQFTKLAVQSWNELHGYPLDNWKEVNMAAQKSSPQSFRHRHHPRNLQASGSTQSSLTKKSSRQS